MDWQPIETAPKDEDRPFLVLIPGNDVCKSLAVQVSNFQGEMYADCMDGIIDWEDRILGATHWSPLPSTPNT